MAPPGGLGHGNPVSPSLPAALVLSLVTGLLPIPLVVPAAPVAPAPVAAAPVAAAPGGPRGQAPGERYGWPLPGSPTVVHDFEPPPHPFGRGHRGVDLAGVPGMPVLAAAAGTVVFAGPVAGRPVVSVHHDGRLRTTYEPVVPIVSPGDRVLAGQRIGTLQAGHPGCEAAACLHWGLLRGDDYLDPLTLLAPGPLRLLPWQGAAVAASDVALEAACATKATVPPKRWTAQHAMRRRSPSRQAGRPDQPAMTSWSLERSRRTARVCNWQTRDSVTPSTRPISARVRFSK